MENRYPMPPEMEILESGKETRRGMPRDLKMALGYCFIALALAVVLYIMS